jgi:kumamolisin
MTDSHVRIEGSERVALPGAQALGRASAYATIEVLVKVRRKKQLPELTGRPGACMTRDMLAATYGASEEDIGKVKAAFAKFGLKTVASSAATRSVRLSGTVAAMEKAFHVTLFSYSSPSGHYRGRVGVVSVPKEVSDMVVGVFGLDNRPVARRRRQPVRDSARPRSLAAVPSSWYKPAELATHYQFPSGDGSGQSIGLVEFGGGFFPSDLSSFCSTAGVAVPTVKPVSVDGTSTSAEDGSEGEVMLDAEIVAGVCPKSNIIIYFAQDWLTVFDFVIQDQANNPDILSISWGAPESAFNTQDRTQITEALKELAHLGITVCVASGDDGSSDAVLDGPAHVNFPASSEYVLSVGGTTIPQKGGTGPDVVWFEGNGLRSSQHGSTGGGVSSFVQRPSWQASLAIDSVNPGAIVGRIMPDIAANADWDASPYLLVVDGHAEPNGGTSAATPLVASLLALINATRGPGKRVGYVTPVLYQSQGATTIGAAGCTDVQSGSNATGHAGGYDAGPGYDAVSGWGTPNGVKLQSALP